jgi:DnaJ like chaperone protein
VFKIICAIAGYFFFQNHFLGAFIGFVIGSVIDNTKIFSGKFTSGNEGEDIFDYYRQHANRTHEDFATMLMALSALIMKADGRPLKVELDFIKSFFSRQFGEQYTREHLKVLKHFLDAQSIPIEQICNDIKLRTQLEVRIQLLHYLFGIAKADSHIADAEIAAIKRIAAMLGVPQSDYESVRSMFVRDANADYHVLGIESTSTNEEVKKAYRQMAIRYHPDKVSQLGEEYQKGAKEKFQKVQEAYENIKKIRGMS